MAAAGIKRDVWVVGRVHQGRRIYCIAMQQVSTEGLPEDSPSILRIGSATPCYLHHNSPVAMNECHCCPSPIDPQCR